MSDAIRELDRQQRAGHFGGAALIATRDQKVVIEHYAGAAAAGLAAGPAVLWPLASISKLYTAAMIVRLVEQGVLTFNTPVHQVIPHYVGGGREEVRVRHLLTHTAGLIYESPEMAARLVAQTPLRVLIDEALRAELAFPPGSAFAYGDNNYLVAGHLAEVATGQPFPTLVEELVIRPMGLRDTFMPPPRSTFDRIAHVHRVMAEDTPGAMYNSPHARALAHPAFGTVTSAADLTRFAHHFAPDGPRIHSEAAVRAMTTDQTGGVRGRHATLTGLSPQANVPWGLGWWLQGGSLPAALCDFASPRAFGAGGASGCQLIVDPETRSVVALLTNTHARIGLELWGARLRSIVNMAYLEASQAGD